MRARIWRYISGQNTQIHVADTESEASVVFRELVSEQLGYVDEEDKKKMLSVLEKYGGLPERM